MINAAATAISAITAYCEERILARKCLHPGDCDACPVMTAQRMAEQDAAELAGGNVHMEEVET